MKSTPFTTAAVVTSTKVIEEATRHNIEEDEVDINLQEAVKQQEGDTVAHTKANPKTTKVKPNLQRNLKEGGTMGKEELPHLVEARTQANGVLTAKGPLTTQLNAGPRKGSTQWKMRPKINHSHNQTKTTKKTQNLPTLSTHSTIQKTRN